MQPRYARRLAAWLLPPTILLEPYASSVPRMPVTSLDPAGLAVLHRRSRRDPVPDRWLPRLRGG